MHSIAAEIAQEIGVLFDNDDSNASARQQEAKHHPGGSTAGNAALCFDRGHGTLCADLIRTAAVARFCVGGSYACFSGIVTTSPSRSSVTLI